MFREKKKKKKKAHLLVKPKIFFSRRSLPFFSCLNFDHSFSIFFDPDEEFSDYYSQDDRPL